jgi:outer membrane biosynthesis protein TonB
MAWAIIGSVLLHGSIVAVFVGLQLFQPPKLDFERKPISAKLVRLGAKPKPTTLPRKTAPTPPQNPVVPTPAQPPPPSPAEAKPAPAPAAAAALPPPEAKAKPKPPSPNRRESLLSVFDNNSAKQNEAIGDPEGDPEGDSDTAEEGERYFGLILAKARRYYGVTKTISPQEIIRLKATVVLFISSTGELLKEPQLQDSSGNEQFDQDVLLALHKAAPFGPPPTHLVNVLKTVGVEVVATP